MTIEEQLAELQDKQAKNEKQIKDQNAYITKLESNKGKSGGVDPEEYKAFQRKQQERDMRDDRRNAREALQEEYGSKIFDMLEDKWEEFSKKQITAPNSSLQFFKSTFELVFAREMKSSESELYKHYRDEEEKPPADPKPAEPAPSDPNPPPVLNRGDNPSATPGGTTPQPTASDTTGAFDSLQATLAKEYTNPYE